MSRWTRLMEMAEDWSNDVDALVERTAAAQQSLRSIGDDVAAHGAALDDMQQRLTAARQALDKASAGLDAIEQQ